MWNGYAVRASIQLASVCVRGGPLHTRSGVSVSCSQMIKHQLMICFTGLSYVRHLKTVRTHLLWLVHHNKITSEDNGVDYTQGLTEQVWRNMYHKGQVNAANNPHVYSVRKFNSFLERYMCTCTCIFLLRTAFTLTNHKEPKTNPVNQSNSKKTHVTDMWEIVCKQITIGFGFPSDWLRTWREVF